MAKGGYLGGSSIVGWNSQNFRLSRAKKTKRSFGPAATALMARLDKTTRRTSGEVPIVKAPTKTSKPKRNQSIIKGAGRSTLTDEEREEAQRSSQRMRGVTVEKKQP